MRGRIRNLCGNYNFDTRNEQVFTRGMCDFVCPAPPFAPRKSLPVSWGKPYIVEAQARLRLSCSRRTRPTGKAAQRKRLPEGVVGGKCFAAASLASAVKEKASPEGEAVKADSRASV